MAVMTGGTLAVLIGATIIDLGIIGIAFYDFLKKEVPEKDAEENKQ